MSEQAVPEGPGNEANTADHGNTNWQAKRAYLVAGPLRCMHGHCTYRVTCECSRSLAIHYVVVLCYSQCFRHELRYFKVPKVAPERFHLASYKDRRCLRVLVEVE